MCSGGGGPEEELREVGWPVGWQEVVTGWGASPPGCRRQVARSGSPVPAWQKGQTAVWHTELPWGGTNGARSGVAAHCKKCLS